MLSDTITRLLTDPESDSRKPSVSFHCFASLPWLSMRHPPNHLMMESKTKLYLAWTAWILEWTTNALHAFQMSESILWVTCSRPTRSLKDVVEPGSTMSGKATRWPWHTKPSNNFSDGYVPTSSGEVLSVDQLESNVAGLIAQLTGHPAIQRCKVVTARHMIFICPFPEDLLYQGDCPRKRAL